MEITSIIARFVADATYDEIPEKAIEVAKTALIDYFGVTLAGSRDECASLTAEIARQESNAGEAAVIGRGFKTSALSAAFVNGTAAHALDFDHSFTLMGQPNAPIIPALTALGESLGAGGRDILEAYVTGFEVTAKLAYSLLGAKEDGWHGPGTIGLLGATAACARLLGLDEESASISLGIAASLACGVVANFGTMTKPLHVGQAARNGILAAKLASSGFTANAEAIERARGFYAMFYPSIRPRYEFIEELGSSFALVTDGIKIKPYPCGGLTHVAIDSVREICNGCGIKPAMIESIDVDVMRYTFDRVGGIRVPQTGRQGMYCMNYLLARAIIDDTISLDMFEDEAVRDPQVLKLAEKVNVRLDENLEASEPAGRPCRVAIHLMNGETHTRYDEHARGSRRRPLTADELEAKFMACARRAIHSSVAQKVIDTVGRLEDVEDIRPLCSLVMG